MKTAIDTVFACESGSCAAPLLASIDDFTRWALEDRSEIARGRRP